jgi:carbamoyl-phosphate synthase large subunit
MDEIRVLVTGAGSGVGQGVMKSLRVSELPVHLIAADVGPMNCGLYRADEALLLPRVEADGALARIVAGIRKSKAQVVMVGSEFDLKFFAHHREEIQAETGAFVVASPLSTVEIAEDKWLTAEFLRQSGLPYAEASIAEDVEAATRTARAWGFPVVLKTRRGTASRHVHVVEDEASLGALFDVTPHPMLQRVIARPSEWLRNEYTCSIFKCSDGAILGPFTARRTLRSGSSWIVEVARFAELEPLLLRIGEKLPTLGSLNVQLMKDEEGRGVPFEFNARFSGTTAVRAHFGFNEPVMAIRSYVLEEKLEQPAIRTGVAMRYLEEVFVDDVRADELGPDAPRGQVHHWF